MKINFIYILIILGSFGSLNAFSGAKNLQENQGWNLAIYMQADNNLRDYAMWDLAEVSLGLFQTGKVKRPNIHVAIDLPGNEGYQLIKIKPKEVPLPSTVEEASQLNLSDFRFEIIETFLEEVPQEMVLSSLINSFSKDKKLFLSLWGHGEGFGAGKLAQFGGVALDDFPSQKLSVTEIRSVLESAEQKVDLLVFDACLMQTLEVSYELKDLASFIVGSTQIHNFKGLPYLEIIKLMHSESTAHDLALTLPELTLNAFSGLHSDKFTMSSINSVEMQLMFLPEFERVLRKLNNALDNDPFLKIEILMQLQLSQSFLGESRDLSSVLSFLEEFLKARDESNILEDLNELRNSMNRMLVSYGYGDFYVYEPDYHLGSFKAFGIWLPLEQFDYQLRKNDFIESSFYKNFPSWPRFLEKLHSTQI